MKWGLGIYRKSTTVRIVPRKSSLNLNLTLGPKVLEYNGIIKPSNGIENKGLKPSKQLEQARFNVSAILLIWGLLTDRKHMSIRSVRDLQTSNFQK